MSSLLTGQGGGGGAKPYDGEKAWSSTNHSILSGSVCIPEITVTAMRAHSRGSTEPKKVRWETSWRSTLILKVGKHEILWSHLRTFIASGLGSVHCAKTFARIHCIKIFPEKFAQICKGLAHSAYTYVLTLLHIVTQLILRRRGIFRALYNSPSPVWDSFCQIARISRIMCETE
jgi:hypothetical protein